MSRSITGVLVCLGLAGLVGLIFLQRRGEPVGGGSGLSSTKFFIPAVAPVNAVEKTPSPVMRERGGRNESRPTAPAFRQMIPSAGTVRGELVISRPSEAPSLPPPDPKAKPRAVPWMPGPPPTGAPPPP